VQWIYNILDEETQSYIILNRDCLIFKEINNETKFNEFQYVSFSSFLFLSFVLFFAWIALVGFQSNEFFFFMFFFVLGDRRL